MIPAARGWIPRLVVLVAAAGACASRRPPPDPLPTTPPHAPSEAATPPSGPAALGSVDRGAAIAALEEAVATAAAPDRAALQVQLGEQRRLAGDRDGARDAFTAAAGDPAWADVSALGLGVLAATAPPAPSAPDGRALDEATLAALSRAPTSPSTSGPGGSSGAPPTLDAARHAALAHHAAATGADPAPAARAALAAARVDASARMALADALAAYLPESASPPQRPDARATPGAAPGAPSPSASADDPWLAVQEALAEGRAAEARALLADAVRAAPDPDRAALYSALADAEPAVRGRLCALLPLSGRFAAVGQQVKDALELGVAGVSGIRLLTEDGGATPEEAVDALDRLTRDRGCLAVLGPLLSDQTGPVADRAELLGVPLLTMSQALDDASDRRWTWVGWTTPAAQVEQLVLHVMGARGFTRFGVFAPDSAYGTAAAALFTASVTARDGTVPRAATYAADARNTSGFARGLGDRRRKEDADAEPMDIDAIFVPEAAPRVPIAAAGLAYEEYAIGGFRPYRGVEPVPLLGLSAWNRDSLVTTGGQYVEGGLFVDVFVPPPAVDGLRWDAAPGWEGFVEAYRTATSRTPSPSEALAHDLARFAADAVADCATRADVRRALGRYTLPAGGAPPRDALGASRGGPPRAATPRGATGLTGIDPATRALRYTLRVLEVQRDGFHLVGADGDADAPPSAAP